MKKLVVSYATARAFQRSVAIDAAVPGPFLPLLLVGVIVPALDSQRSQEAHHRNLLLDLYLKYQP